MKFLTQVKNRISTFAKNADVYACDIEQNPEMVEEFGVAFTPTTVVQNNGVTTLVVSGANKMTEVERAVK